jgi:cytochrome c
LPGTAEVNDIEETWMKAMMIALVAAGSLTIAGAAAAQSGAELAKSKGCTTCHDVSAKKVGPSWADISAKHKGDKAAADTIVMKLKEGKGHPKVAASDAELKTLTSFALAGGK